MAATLSGRLKAELEPCDEGRREVVLKFLLEPWQVKDLGAYAVIAKKPEG